MTKPADRRSVPRRVDRPQDEPSSPLTAFGAKQWLLAAALVAAVFIAYQPAWNGGPIWDDDAHLTRPDLRSLHGLYRIWFDVGATPQYYPLLHTVFWVEYGLWGGTTLGYHLLNILLHACAALMVALILRRLAVPGAFLAAAIFALHPVHVESVAWITELKNTLSAVFYLGAAMLYLRFDRERRIAWYLWAFGLFLLALMSKTVTGTLPGALMVVFWWQRGRLSARKDMLPLVPFVLAGAGGGMITAWWELKINGCVGPEFAFTTVERLLLAGRAVWFHAWKLFWPTNLTFIYPRWQLDSSAWWQYLFPVGLAALVAAFWAVRNRTRAPLAALLYFVGTLFPVLGFFNLYTFKYSLIANHYQYLASVGLIALASAGIVRAIDRWRPRPGWAGTALCVALPAILAVLTWQQSRMYSDVETLYRTTIRQNPGCWMAYNNLSLHMTDGGRYEEAIDLLNQAIRLKPDQAGFHNNMGKALAGQDRIAEAIEQYREAVRLAPNIAEVHNNLGNALATQGRLPEAVEEYGTALKLRPDFAEARNNLGSALAREGRIPEALEQYDRAIALRPDYAEAHYNRAEALAGGGRIEEAIVEYRQALGVKPDYVDAYYNLGNSLLRAGRPAEAVEPYNQALRLRPGYAEAHNNLGIALGRLGRTAEAIQQYNEALRLKPDFDQARANLLKAQGYTSR